MDIEEFYDADPRRRSSAEIELGGDWHDEHGVGYELSWVEDTGELYVIREAATREWATPFGGVHVRGVHSVDEQEVEGMTVTVIATVATQNEVERLFDGWQAAMEQPDSVKWLVDRLHAAGVIVPPAAEGSLTI